MEGVTGSIPVAPTTQSLFSPTSRDLASSPATGGLFRYALAVSGSLGRATAHFRQQSPRRKFPFLALKRCGVENVTSWLSLLDGTPFSDVA